LQNRFTLKSEPQGGDEVIVVADLEGTVAVIGVFIDPDLVVFKFLGQNAGLLVIVDVSASSPCVGNRHRLTPSG